MYSGLISDLAERASSVFCDGAVSAATETDPSTVMLCASSLTFSERETFSVPPAASFTPVRRLVAKLGAEASMVYKPSGRPVIENLPSWSATTMRGGPEDSFFTETAAFGIGFPATSMTVPAMVPVLLLD